MAMIDSLYEAAVHAGFLKACVWQPADGAPPQTQFVGFAAPDDTRLDGLTATTEYVMTYPATAFTTLAVRDTVTIDATTFQVREVRAVGDGSERRARLTRL